MVEYVHGYDAEEQGRLTRMQAILNRAQLREMNLAGVRSILDVGAGLGQLARDLARAAEPGARVVGVEREEKQRAEAARQAAGAGEAELVEFRGGDATALPLGADEIRSFDLVHARFLLEHVPDPQAVVNEMARAVRPGGRMVLVDDDHEQLRFSPDCLAGADVWSRYWEGFRDHGFDPLVGRRLPDLLRHAGAVDVRVAHVFYGATRGDALFDSVVDNLIEVMRSAASDLDRTGRLPRAELEAGFAALSSWREHPAATVWYSLPLAQGTFA